jgi:hypothetical protein
MVQWDNNYEGLVLLLIFWNKCRSRDKSLASPCRAQSTSLQSKNKASSVDIIFYEGIPDCTIHMLSIGWLLQCHRSKNNAKMGVEDYSKNYKAWAIDGKCHCDNIIAFSFSLLNLSLFLKAGK